MSYFPRTLPKVGGRMRAHFDHKATFIVMRPMKINGEFHAGGATLNKNLLSMRRIRQMYDNRMLRMADKMPEPEFPTKPPFDDITDEELKQWLTSHNIVVRPGKRRSSRKTLLEKANTKWEELMTELTQAHKARHEPKRAITRAA